MLKELIKKRIFHWMIILVFGIIVFSSIFFYLSSQTQLKTLDASIVIIREIVSQKNLIDSISTGISELFSLAMIQMFIFLIISLFLFIIVVFLFRLYLIENKNALLDSLTGVYNSKAIHFGLNREIERARKFGHPLSAAILDIDSFRHYNSIYGLKVGDLALRKIASLIDKSIMNTDLVGRLNGEKFLIIFPETSRNKALNLCERLKSSIEKLNLDKNKEMPGKEFTVSIGLAEFKDHKIVRPIEFMQDIEKHLYLAKLAGKNCIK